MTERDPLLTLRGLIDEPIAPRSAFADELRARLLAELESHRSPAIDEERTMEITTPGLRLTLPVARQRRLPSWRQIAEVAAAVLILFSLIAVFASERVGSPPAPKPSMEANLGVSALNFATPEPGAVTENEAKSGVLWKVDTGAEKTPLVDVVNHNGVSYFLEQGGYLYAVDSASGLLLWKANIGSNWGVAIDDSGAYVTARLPGPNTSTRLVKLDLATGQEAWRLSLGDTLSSQPMLSNGVAYVWDAANTLYAVDTERGTVEWQQQFAQAATGDTDALKPNGLYRPSAMLDGAVIFAVTSDGLLGSISLDDAERGVWTWSAKLESEGQRFYSLATTADTVAVVSLPTGEIDQSTSSLVVFDRASGAELWRNAADELPGTIFSDGNSYIVSLSRPVEPTTPVADFAAGLQPEAGKYAARTGEVEWTTANFIPRAITPDGSIAISYFGDGFLTLVDTASGEILGSAYPFGVVYSPFAMTNDTLFGIRSDGMLVAIDLDALKNGKLQGGADPTPTVAPAQANAVRWEVPAEPRAPANQIVLPVDVVAYGGTTYFLGQNDDLIAVDSASGEVLWTATVGTNFGLAVDDTGVYVTAGHYDSTTGIKLIKLGLATGAPIWDVDVSGDTVSQPMLHNGLAYIWGGNNTLTVIDTMGGSLVSAQSLGTASSSPPTLFTRNGINRPAAMIENNALFAVSSDGMLGAIAISEGQPGSWLWQQPLASPPVTDTPPRLAIAGNAVAALSWENSSDSSSTGNLQVFDTQSGTPLWQSAESDHPTYVASAGSMFVVTYTLPSNPATPRSQFEQGEPFESRAQDAETGEVIWTRPQFTTYGATPGGSIVIGISLFTEDLSGGWSLSAIDAENGAVLGSTRLDTLIVAPPYAVTDEGVYGLGSGGALVAIDLAALTNGMLNSTPTTTEEATPSPAANAGVRWEIATDQALTPMVDIVAYGGTTYYLGQTGDLWAIDSASGKQRWHITVGQDFGLAVDDSGVYVTAAHYRGKPETQLIKLDAGRGDPLWAVEIGGVASSQPLLRDGNAFIWDANNWLTVVDTEQGTILSTHTLANSTAPSSLFSRLGLYRPDAVLIDDTLYAITSDGMLGSIAIDGDQLDSWLWQQPLKNGGGADYQIAVSGDAIAVRGIALDITGSEQNREPSTGTVQVFDRQTGKALWQSADGEDAIAVTAAGSAMAISYALPSDPATPQSQFASTESSELRAFDAVTGELRWTLPGFLALGATPDGSMIIASSTIPSSIGWMVAADTQSGAILGSLKPDMSLFPPEIVTNDAVYGMRQDGALVAIDVAALTNGEIPGGMEPRVETSTTPQSQGVATSEAIAWTTDGTGENLYAGSVAVSGNVLLRATTTDSGSQIDAFVAQTGAPLWSKPFSWTGGLVVGDGFVYVPVRDGDGINGSIIAITPETGDVVWEQLVSGIPLVPALVGDRLYVATDSSFFSAFDATNGEPDWQFNYWTDPVPGYAGPPVPSSVMVSPPYLVALIPTRGFVISDLETGKLIYQLPDESIANTRYTVLDGVLVVLTSSGLSPATPTGNEPPLIIKGIDLQTGMTLWENDVRTRLDQQLIVVQTQDGPRVQFIAEAMETKNGLFNNDGFLPDGTIDPNAPVNYDLGTLMQIDPSTGEATKASIGGLYPYNYTTAFQTLGAIGIDLSVAPVNLDQPLATNPAEDTNRFYLLLADGSVIAVKKSAYIGG